jgi:hypothetical protein
MRVQNGTGLPEYFTVTDQIEFNRVPDTDYDVELQYYAIPAPLTDANPTNAILTEFPAIYLFGALWVLNQYAVEPAIAAQYFDSFIGAIKGANKKDKQGRYGPAPAMTPAGTVV